MEKIKEGIIVSCQPNGEDEYFYDIEFIKRFSLAAQHGGAVALRLEGANTISVIKKIVDLPLVGLIKKQKKNSVSNRNITTTLNDINDLYEAGADVIAVDFTFRENCSGHYYHNIMKEINDDYENIKILADISTFEEAISAEKCGVDFISTTLSGYTSSTVNNLLPDFSLLTQLLGTIKTPVIAEGGYSEIDHIRKALNLGCKHIVIGTALTRPHVMIENFNKLWKTQ